MPEHLPLPEISPYKACFKSIEVAAASQPLTAAEAYRLYDDYLVGQRLDPTIYLSMAITSGGYKRDEQLGIGEVINRNTEFGSLAAGALIQQFPVLDRGDIVVPSELGKVKEWSQADYLLFWSHVIVGVEPSKAAAIEEIVKQQGAMELEGFSNSSLSDEKRWQDYAGFISAYVNAYNSLGYADEPNNMQAAVFILDKEMSLGARAEELLCRKLGIPPQFQPLDISVLRRSEQTFRDHVEQFCGLGATALGTVLNKKPDFSFAGISQGQVDMAPAHKHGFRKLGLLNAISTKEFYTEHPDARPPRHRGHRPLSVSV